MKGMVNEMIVEHGLLSFLEKFDENPFLVKMQGKEYKIGEGEPTFTVRFNKSIPVSNLLTSTSIALGEAYMNGDLEIEGDLYNALDHFLGQMGKFSTDQNALKKLIFTSSSKKNQEREVYILKKLYLQEDMTLLDIGCGWGFLLIEAARKYKVRGTGITLSEEQYKECQRRIEEEGLEDYVKVERMDYRDLPKLGEQFDRVVSVGMVEHVGRDNYKLFLECANKVMKKGGLFLLHFISALKEHPGDAWIKKYIFPGGVVPSLREMINEMAEFDFHTMDVENLRLHYNRTLRCWRKNYLEHLDEVRKMFDEKFIRMWDLYLAACAATFHNGIIDIHQILMTKGINNDLPMVRWY